MARHADDVLVDEAQSSDAAALRRLENLAHWLDDRFRLPGTNIRMGFDSLIGLIPGIGDTATGLLGAYILLEAYRLGAPASVLARMLANLGIDVAVGSIPVLGDVFDVGWKSHRRNVRLLIRHLDELGRLPRPPRQV